VIEILARVHSVSDGEAAKFFFKDLAESNGIQSENDLIFHPIPVSSSSPFTANKNAPESDLLLIHAGETVVHLCAGIGIQKNIAMGSDYDVLGNSRRHLQDIKSIRLDLVVLRLIPQQTEVVVSLSTPLEDGAETTEMSTLSPIVVHAISTLKMWDWGLFGG